MQRVVLIALMWWSSLAVAGEVKVAVAANFTAAMKEIVQAFGAATGHQAIVSYGSTGKLYTQILHGAPFEVFLSADRQRPALLHKTHHAEAPFTYAVGKLVLWSPDPGRVDSEGAVLKGAGFTKLAVANPKTAPYGVGAIEILERLGLLESVRSKLVYGDNAAQTYQFVLTGNAQLGLVALSQVVLEPVGSRWAPPDALYTPILQDAALLARGVGNPAATALIEFLRGPTARAVIERFGYGVP